MTSLKWKVTDIDMCAKDFRPLASTFRSLLGGLAAALPLTLFARMVRNFAEPENVMHNWSLEVSK